MDILPQNNKIKYDKNYYIDYIDCYLKSEKSLVKFFKFSLYIIIAGLISLIFYLTIIVSSYGMIIFDNSFFENTLFIVAILIFLYVFIFEKKISRKFFGVNLIFSSLFVIFYSFQMFKYNDNIKDLFLISIIFTSLYNNNKPPSYATFRTKLQIMNKKSFDFVKLLIISSFVITIVSIINRRYIDDIHALLSLNSKQINNILFFTFGLMSFFILLGFLILAFTFLYEIKQINKLKLLFIKGEINIERIQYYICSNIESQKVIDNMKEKIDLKYDYVLTLYRQIQQNQSLIENKKNNDNSDKDILELLIINKHKINSAIVMLSSIITTFTEKYEQSPSMTKQELIEKTEPYMTMWKWIDSTQKDNDQYISQLKKKIKKNKHK